MSELGELHTGFRSVLRRLYEAERMMRVRTPVDPHLELPAFVKNLDGDLAFFFERVNGCEIPVCCNLLASRKNALAALGVDLQGLRAAVQRAIDHPIPPVEVEKGRCQEVVVTEAELTSSLARVQLIDRAAELRAIVYDVDVALFEPRLTHEVETDVARNRHQAAAQRVSGPVG